MVRFRQVVHVLAVLLSSLALALCGALLVSPSFEALAWGEFRAYLPIVVRCVPAAPYPGPHTGSVSVLPNHSQMWVDRTLYILGEVHNTTANNVGMVKVTVGLYNAQGQRVHSAFAFVDLSTVRPNAKASFKIFSYDPPAFVRYAFDAPEYTIDCAPEPLLTVIDTQGRCADPQTFTVQGAVRNDSSQLVASIQLAGTLYDAAGKVIGHEGAFSQEFLLQPGQTTPYEITFLTDGPRVASFAVQADGVLPH